MKYSPIIYFQTFCLFISLYSMKTNSLRYVCAKQLINEVLDSKIKIENINSLLPKDCIDYLKEIVNTDFEFKKIFELSVKNNNLQNIEKLAKLGINLNSPLEQDLEIPSLAWAAMLGNKKTVDKLIELGANIDYRDSIHKSNILMFSIFLFDWDKFAKFFRRECKKINLFNKLLLERVNAVRSIAKNLINHHDVNEDAIFLNMFPYIQLKNMEDIPDLKIVQMLFVAKSNYSEIIKKLVKSGMDINATDDRGNTILIRACLIDANNVVELLLKLKANINASNKKGLTPLKAAVKNSNMVLTKLLVSCGADINHSGKNRKRAPIHLAMISKNSKIVEFLISKGANPDQYYGKYKYTPLMLAIGSYSLEMIVILLNSNIDINKTNKVGSNALDVALTIGSHDVRYQVIKLIKTKHPEVKSALFPNIEFNIVKPQRFPRIEKI